MKESIIGNNVILRAFHDEDAAFFAHWYPQEHEGYVEKYGMVTINSRMIGYLAKQT
ncbi:hypothetical protein [Pectinatus frisingensis]|uniref:hypothetical protein n=1 Tax=Pectinatus frisingensis TaxID=865 RepID=UPI0018C5CBB9|nr:hypothetical protein [Pectinatus frisingensis]